MIMGISELLMCLGMPWSSKLAFRLDVITYSNQSLLLDDASLHLPAIFAGLG